MKRPSLKQRLADRKARNLGLGQLDRSNRCAVCKQALPVKAYERFGDPKKYCSLSCVESALERPGVQ